MAEVNASIGTQHYQVEVKTAANIIIADEPLSLGGQDLGFSPDELLAASLSACTCATLRMYADRKGWTELEGVQVHTTFNRSNDASAIVRTISFQGPLSEEQKERLLYIANKCPLHQTLTQPIHIKTQLT